MQGNLFWQLGALSDEALVAGLTRVVASGRRMLAELLAHLCEVENRRLHLDAGYSSMFAYCTGRLALSEDEAYRRIEVARLARRAPIVFALVADGRLSLSAAALLKPHVLADNLPELVRAVSDKSVQAARETLAALFPRPDAADGIRRLPELERATPRPNVPSLFELPQATRLSVQVAESAAARHQATACQGGSVHGAREEPSFDTTTSIEHGAPLADAQPPVPPLVKTPRTPAFEPLSAGRYKVSFTAGRALKEKLELARDLMRHSSPGGDLATIVDRALDLLVTDLMKRRFGAGARQRSSSNSNHARHTPQTKPALEFTAFVQYPELRSQPAPPATDHSSPAADIVPRALRRAILERDGLRCTWRGPDGTRCTARAWLERDHKHARSLGGTTQLENLRHLCRSHNRHAAEHVHGHHHIERSIQRRRKNANARVLRSTT